MSGYSHNEYDEFGLDNILASDYNVEDTYNEDFTLESILSEFGSSENGHKAMTNTDKVQEVETYTETYDYGTDAKTGIKENKEYNNFAEKVESIEDYELSDDTFSGIDDFFKIADTSMHGDLAGEYMPDDHDKAEKETVNYSDIEDELASKYFDLDEMWAETQQTEFEDKYSKDGENADSEQIVTEAIERDIEASKSKKKLQNFLDGIFNGKKHVSAGDVQTDEDDVWAEQELEENDDFFMPEPEEPEEEPDLQETYKCYFSKLHSLYIRSFLSFVLSIAMAYISIGKELNFGVSEIFKTNTLIYSGVMLILLLLVMLCGVPVIITGIADFIRLEPGGESLVTLACLASVADSLYTIITGTAECGTPLSAAAAFVMSFALCGARMVRNSYRTTFKCAMASAEPYTITIRKDLAENGTLLVKTQGDTYGFVKRAEEADAAEYAYTYAAPILIIAAVIMALICTRSGGAASFLHSFSAMMICAASFTALLAGSLPFSKITKYLSKCGAVLAGYSGADEISESIGVIVTDQDIFPDGNLSLNGIKIYSEASNDKVIAYTASAIAESKSGLTKIFLKLLKGIHKPLLPVENFDCYDGGGIGCEIFGDSVYVGSSGFMNLMGVRIPTNISIKNAVFTSINGELAGVFAVNYVPTNSVQNALLSLLGSKIMTVFAVRDFNITPLMLQQKFKIPTDGIEFLNAGDRYKLSADINKKEEFPPAILFREGLGPLAETVCGGIRYKMAVKRNTAISIIGAAMGELLMFYLCASGAFVSVSVINILIYMFMWLVPVMLVSGGVNKY